MAGLDLCSPALELNAGVLKLNRENIMGDSSFGASLNNHWEDFQGACEDAKYVKQVTSTTCVAGSCAAVLNFSETARCLEEVGNIVTRKLSCSKVRSACKNMLDLIRLISSGKIL